MVWAVFGPSMFAYGSRAGRRRAQIHYELASPLSQSKLFITSELPVNDPMR
jgi:hypothetical protein